MIKDSSKVATAKHVYPDAERLTLRERFSRLLYLALQMYGIIPKDQLSYVKVSRRVNLQRLYERVYDLPGVAVECGVARGDSLALLKILSIAEGKNRPIIGYDTFEGLPEPAAFERGVRGQFGHSKAAVVQFFKDRQVPMDGITLVRGDIRDTLKDFESDIAFLHIDLDLYEGYKAALSYLWDKVVPGGIVLFDDYGYDWAGADKAVDEFVAAHPKLELNKERFANKTYLIKPPADAQ